MSDDNIIKTNDEQPGYTLQDRYGGVSAFRVPYACAGFGGPSPFVNEIMGRVAISEEALERAKDHFHLASLMLYGDSATLETFVTQVHGPLVPCVQTGCKEQVRKFLNTKCERHQVTTFRWYQIKTMTAIRNTVEKVRESIALFIAPWLHTNQDCDY